MSCPLDGQSCKPGSQGQGETHVLFPSSHPGSKQDSGHVLKRDNIQDLRGMLSGWCPWFVEMETTSQTMCTSPTRATVLASPPLPTGCLLSWILIETAGLHEPKQCFLLNPRASPALKYFLGHAACQALSNGLGQFARTEFHLLLNEP